VTEGGDPSTPADVLRYYESGAELGRLETASGQLELERMKELIGRFRRPGDSVLDIGGGDGVYSSWLAGLGHRVTLVEPVALHRREAQSRAGEPPAFEVVAGDARTLPVEDEAFDVVLMLGPLYHLGEREERLHALAEARRVCRLGGLLLVAAISRYAGALHTLRVGTLADEQVAANVDRELADGRRVPPELRRGPLPDAHFHLPDELVDEVEAAGLELVGVFGIEGPGWLLTDLEERWRDAVMRERIVWLARRLERDAAGLATSAHLLAVGRRV